MPCVLKFLAPEALASAVIGKGGVYIASLRQKSQAKIALTEHNQLYPGTNFRIITVQGPTEDSLTTVTEAIVAKLEECVKAEPTTDMGTLSELKIGVLMPRAAVGGLMGARGASIKKLRESSGAKINVNEAYGRGPSAEQMVSITGTSAALVKVIAEVKKQVQALKEEPWFNDWTTSTNTSWGSGYSYSGWEDGYDYGGRGRAGGSGGYGYKSGGNDDYWPSDHWSEDDGVALMRDVAANLPSYVMEDSRGFALSCVVPSRLAGGLIGRGGSGTREVEARTGTKIGLRDIPGDPENRSMNITGPLANTCAAYMLMMKRYLDAEAVAIGSTYTKQGSGAGAGD